MVPRYPFPLIGGDRVKSYHLLKILAQRHNVTCVSFVEDHPLKPEYIQAVEELGVKVYPISLHKVKAAMRVALTSLSAKPLEVQYYMDARFRRMVRMLHRLRPFDLAISFFMRTAEYARELPGTPRILIAEDARILLQQRAISSFRLSPGYFMRSLEHKKLLHYEPRIINEFDAVTYVSEAERAFMQKLNPEVRTAVITNGVDTDEFAFSADQSHRKGIIFCGKMDVMHNVDMAVRIGKEIFPRLKKEFPDLEYTIAGKNPVRAVRALARNDIHVLGEVPHVQESIRSAALFVHPQKVGTGIQNKILETMALGTPVVTTPLGISGINAQDGVHARITRTEDFVAVCAQLLRSEIDRARMAQNARALIEREHTWEAVASQMDAVMERVVGAPHKTAMYVPIGKEMVE
ncbi:MAG TPA: glycosyltransferase [Candidatus Kapabacteria bacterium]|nr:glycosyltransferase [Candidatus Kapabacteria bacterium]